MSVKKRLFTWMGIAAMGSFAFYACSKEEETTNGLEVYSQSVLGRWNVVYQGQFNNTDTTRDTIVGTDADFMDFGKNDTVMSNTILFGEDTSPFTILNVQRFLIGADTVHNASLVSGMLNLYIRQPLTDSTYTQWWVDLKKAD
ncbi:hypothetical protein SAMN05421788_102104 [Filimonas lacunae]|uniref:Lipocalin-like domain-containing protein n=1 Tax=Filimonas lacunae TaxID=477680 RepID=A0A173MI18_9BACT|nr:hypothetical protein [Filimonas lacunae]BAV07272.1 hypothetical protein FLA_3295 [Filimonas lacunae]SIS92219.1 hypothetical protein SAMN05421788_102104 [Filimonas lacunae]